MKGVSRFRIAKPLADTFDMVLYMPDDSKQTFEETPENAMFRFAFTLDKSAVAADTLTVTLNPPVSIDGKEGHDTQIERISIAPTGSTITLHDDFSKAVQPGSDYIPLAWEWFILRDENGRCLPRADESWNAGDTEATNNFSFYGASTETKSITVVPYTFPETDAEQTRIGLISGALDELPLTNEAKSGYTLEKLTFGDHQATGEFSIRGDVETLYVVGFKPINADGESLGLNCYTDNPIYDAATGRFTETITYLDATDEQIAQIAGVSFWQAEPLVLHEDQAVTIPLQ